MAKLVGLLYSNKLKKFLTRTLIIFLEIVLIVTSYGGAYSSISEDAKVEAYDTVNWTHCEDIWPNFPAGKECYIRGTYESWSGWNANMRCNMTNRIVYPSGHKFYFCHTNSGLTGKEVLVFVKWNGLGGFQIISSAESAENFNQIPNQPTLNRPQGGWEMGPRNTYTGVTCDTSGTGLGCSVDFNTNSYDPDFFQSLKLEAQVIEGGGANRNYTKTFTANNQTYTKTQTLTDGNWQFRARNCDTVECSGYTTYRSFMVDTTAPTGVDMIAESEFTMGLQNTVSSTTGSDNLSGGIEYMFEMDDDPAFTSTNASSGWITTNSFIFASLTNDTEYFYRVKSRDRLYNTSDWSAITTSSTQDATVPEIQNLVIDNQRISPINQDEQFDTVIVNFDWIEKYSLETKSEVLDASNNVVRTIVDALPTGSEVPLAHQFTWDGKDDTNTDVIDGPYTLKVYVTDKAGNVTFDDSTIVIVDNIPADINVSTPSDGAWFNYYNFTVNGQTESDALAWITSGQTSLKSALTLDGLGLFQHDDFLVWGANQFTLDAEDLVKNQNQLIIDYYREDLSPSIDSILPNSKINLRQPSVDIDLSDVGYDDGQDIYTSGIDSDSLYISLTHPVNGELVLVNEGVNIQPALGNIQEDCNTPGLFGNSTAETCTYNFVFTSDLTPDGDYTVTARADDTAGNSAVQQTQNYTLDSNIQSDLSTPSDGDLFNYSQITLTGTAEKNSEILISLPLGDIDLDLNIDTETFVVSDLATNNARVTISNCRASSNPTQDGIVEICDWEVTDFQLEKDLINPGNVTNQIQIDTKDNIDIFPGVGLNTKSESINVNIDLYAVSLTIDTDIEYFSPNGDGRQDGINFNSISTNGQILTYILEIKDDQSNIIKSFGAGGTPPSGIPWDGRDAGGTYVTDGVYTYQLKITTTDGIIFETPIANLYAVTELTDTVVITSPKNDSYSSRGVINVQGQAPQSLVLSNGDTELQVKVCVDTMAIAGTCDTEFYTTVNEYGSFSTVITLPRLNALDEHYLTATALDKYGNETPPSNQVKVTTTINPPFDSIEIIPVLTGTNDPAAYQIIIDKLDSGQEITQADIDSLRSVIMRSTVYQGTERVKFFFADYSQIDELPDITDWNSIGYITGDNTTHLYQEFIDGTTPYISCDSTTCTWDFYFPLIPEMQGLYEVRFEGKLDAEVVNLSAGFMVDGNIPIAPIILDINKVIGSDSFNTNYYNDTFYSNSEIIQIRGASDPGATIEVKDNLGNTICTTTASTVGIWSCEVDTSSIPAYSNPDTTTYTIPLTTYATLGLNTSVSVDDKTVVIDKIAPIINQTNTDSYWRKSGDVVDMGLVANESLSNAIAIDFQDLPSADLCINTTSTYDLFGVSIPIQLGAIDDLIVDPNNLANADGSFIISGNAVEGRYCTTLKIYDLAGNSTKTGQTFFIDDTSPSLPFIDINNWGKYNGIDTVVSNIADGRLVPEFVHEESSISIKAWGEENTKLEFYVNSALKSTSDLVTAECTQDLDADKISDTVNVQDKDICTHSFNYTMTKNGGDYVFQVKSVDRAGNKSIISEDEVVYFDNQNPKLPEVYYSASSSYNPTPNWSFGDKSSLTKDLKITLTTHTESLSDLQYWITGPQSFSDYIFTETPGDQFKLQSVYLGTVGDDKDGCVEMQDTRRTGICQDGDYTIKIKSTDAAGNASNMATHTVERDTVRPERPIISLSKSGDTVDERMGINIKGEKNASARIQINLSTGKSYRLVRSLGANGNYTSNDLLGKLECGDKKYTVSVNIVDTAGNVGFISDVADIITGECPFCGNSSGLFEKPVHNDAAYIGYFYGISEKYFSGNKFHSGVDYNGVYKGEPIYSAAIGTVIKTVSTITCEGCSSKGYGNYVEIDHGQGVVSVYAHLNSVKVEEGDIVGTNTQIGTMGSTGYSTGVHLHFGIKKDGKLQDPVNYLGQESTNLSDSQFAEYCKAGGTGGTSTKPWGGKDADDLGKPKVIIKQDRNENITTELSPNPILTYIDSKTLSAENKILVHGLGSYKHQIYRYEYWEEVCNGFLGICIGSLGRDWEKIVDEDREINNASIDIYKEGEISWNKRLGRLWNDTPSDGRYGYTDNDGDILSSGKWLTNGALPGEGKAILLGTNTGINDNINLNYGDNICSKSIIFDNDFDAEVTNVSSDWDCKKIEDQNTILLDVPLIREDVCEKPEYENQYLHGDSSCTGYLCRTLNERQSVTGCHVIAMAMVHSYFTNNKKEINLKSFNNIFGQYGCSLNWYATGITQPTYIYHPYDEVGDDFKITKNNKLKFSIPNPSNPNSPGKTYKQSIDDSLENGKPVIIQIDYTHSSNSGNGDSALHAFVIVGKKNGIYLVNDQYYGQDNQMAFGKRFTTLNYTIDLLLNNGGAQGGTDQVKIIGLYFFSNTKAPNNPFLDPNTQTPLVN